MYAYLSQVLPYTDHEQEMLYSFGRFLLPHLPLDRDDTMVGIRDGENDRIVMRYMSDREFRGSAFPALAREIFETVRARQAGASPGAGVRRG